MAKIDIEAVSLRRGSRYPTPHDAPCRMRERRPLGDAAGLTQFGVNLLTLPPGAWSSQRHWHSAEDEFVWVLEGEVVLVTDDGRSVLRTGDCAGFSAGRANGHHFVNPSLAPARLLEVGARSESDRTVYSDIDMVAEPGEAMFRHRDGTPYSQS